MSSRLYGSDTSQAVSRQELLRDTRGVHRILVDVCADPVGLPILMALLGVFILLVPQMFLPGVVIGVGAALYGWPRIYRERLPMRLPKSSRRKDYGDRTKDDKGRDDYRMAEGVFYIGIHRFLRGVRSSGLELWAASRDILTHSLIFGTTGAGKTEAMLSLLTNFLCFGSGFYYLDAKGDKQLIFKVAALARIFGRDDDLRVQNFSTSSLGPEGQIVRRRSSNYMNPFSYGRHDSLTNVVTALIDVPSGGDNVVFGQNAISAMTVMMRAACARRDHKMVPLTVNAIRDMLTIPGMADLMYDEEIPQEVRDSVRSFMVGMGYNESYGPEEQSKDRNSDLPRQFGYAKAYFNRMLTSLVDVYGYIFGEDYGEIDGRDAVYQGRIVVGALPSLEKAEEELRNLGKITLSSIKFAIASAMGDKTVGRYADVIGTMPSRHRVPYAIAVDEYAAIPTPGFVQTVTQGRGYGFSAFIGTQDYPGLKRASEEEAGQVVANCKMKYFMAQEDPQDTFNLVESLAGADYYKETSGDEIRREQALAINYRDQLRTEIRERKNVDLRDLRDQIEGEFHLFFKANVIRGTMFYANVPQPDDFQMRIPEMLMMRPPNISELSGQFGQASALAKRMARLIDKPDERPPEMEIPEHDDVKSVWDAVGAALDQSSGPDRAILGLLAYERATRNLVFRFIEGGDGDAGEDGVEVRETELAVDESLIEDSAEAIDDSGLPARDQKDDDTDRAVGGALKSSIADMIGNESEGSLMEIGLALHDGDETLAVESVENVKETATTMAGEDPPQAEEPSSRDRLDEAFRRLVEGGDD